MEARGDFTSVQQSGTAEFLHRIDGKAGGAQPLVGGFGVVCAEDQGFQPKRRTGDFLARGGAPGGQPSNSMYVPSSTIRRLHDPRLCTALSLR